jgi:hypothetical protein
MAEQNKQKAYLLSFPRSGNTWVRYFVEFLTKHPTKQIHDKNADDQIIGKKLEDLEVDLKKHSILLKMHAMKDVRFKKSYRSHKLIILVRNPFEAIIRDIQNKDRDLVLKRFHKYMHILDTYDRWEADRLIVYYEDLLTKPRTTIRNILNFLGLSTSRLNEFMENYDAHKKRSIKHYNNTESGSKTGGDTNKLVYHSKNTPASNLEIIRKMLEGPFKNLTNKYLMRYM